MAIFSLKRGDTRPILEVALLEPDPANPGEFRPFDLTGSTGWHLHIWLSDGSKLKRVMVKEGADEEGVLRYAWIASDWDAVSGGGTVGGLVVGPELPLAPEEREHRMEYEVVGGGGARITFPNSGANAGEAYDTLRIWNDIGNG